MRGWWCALLLACGVADPGGGEASSGESTAVATSSGPTTSASGETSSTVTSASSTTTTSTATTESSGESSESSTTGEPADDELVGWASVEGDGVRTTTGGEGGEVVVVTTLEELVMYAGAEEPYVIQISGTIVGEVTVASNKTIEGLADARIEGSLEIQGDEAFVSNVIVRNLTIAGVACPGDGCSSTDAVRIYRAHHVWIDHCDISDGDDGNLDITAEADYVTVSWCRFSYSSASGSHRFSNLVGAADESTEDADDLGITFHHNWWADNIAERMPRVRFGDVHVFNNYYTPVGSSYCIRPGVEANLLVENNYFDGQEEPFDTTDPTASIAATGNAFAPDPVEEPMQGDVFDPPYPYMHVLDDAADVPAIVQAGAGPA